MAKEQQTLSNRRARALGVVMLSLLLLSACGTQDTEQRRQLGVLVLAVAGEEVFAGRAVTFAADGTLTLNSLTTNGLSCRGRFKFMNLPNGKGKFSCSDGNSGRLRLYADQGFYGYGSGSSTMGDVTLVFGHRIDQANASLPLPEGTRLGVVTDKIVLIKASGVANSGFDEL